jgi:hypothetical protein
VKILVNIKGDDIFTAEAVWLQYYKHSILSSVKFLIKLYTRLKNSIITDLHNITWNIIEQGTRKIHVTEQVTSVLINDGKKRKDPDKFYDVLNSFSLAVAEKLNLHQVWK